MTELTSAGTESVQINTSLLFECLKRSDCLGRSQQDEGVRLNIKSVEGNKLLVGQLMVTQCCQYVGENMYRNGDKITLPSTCLFG